MCDACNVQGVVISDGGELWDQGTREVLWIQVLSRGMEENFEGVGNCLNGGEEAGGLERLAVVET